MAPPRVDYVKRFQRFLRRLIVDDRCLGCGRTGGRLCTTCDRALPRATATCIGCSRYVRDGRTCGRCADAWHIDTLIAAHPYTAEPVAALVRTFKYRLEHSLAEQLSRDMARTLVAARFARPVIVPVPLHTQRERWRGFDQAALLARAVASRTLFTYHEVLERTRNTPQQAKAPHRTRRLAAMQGAFRVRYTGSVNGRDVILVDDVCTTGATIAACAAALRDSGAATVTALVYAR